MKIIYAGNFRHSHCTEVHVARSLRGLGHVVVEVQEDEHSPGALTGVLEQGMDLFLFTRTWGNCVEGGHLLDLLRRGVPTVSYHLDLYYGLARGGAGDAKSAVNIGRDPFWLTDYVFSPDGDPRAQAFFESQRINHWYMPPAVVADECYLADVPLSRDVVFVGSRRYHPEWPYRPELLNWLERSYGSRFEWFGRPGEPVRGDALNRLYASTKVVVGDSLCLNYDHVGYWSDRIPETLGRGGFLIHPEIQGMAEAGFVDGETLATYTYGDLDGLREKIDFYLAHDVERERIRRAGHELVKSRHTYTHRMREMLDVLAADGVL